MKTMRCLLVLSAFAIPAWTQQVFTAGVRTPSPRARAALFHVNVASLRTAVLGDPYADTLRATNISKPAPWSIRSGSLPPGITLNPETGALHGTPSQVGMFRVTLSAAGGPRVGVAAVTIVVSMTASATDLIDALLGSPNLNSEQIRFLDEHGNRNGMLDVGDLRAYLRAQGQLAASRN